jgi:TRAP-type mannitol/chloroaromatic compound transport system substrate-binding protein
MTKEKKSLKVEKLSRRKFFKAAAVTGAAAVGTLAMPNIASAATTLKVQAAWGGGIFLENAQAYVKRVNEMSGGKLKIDLLPVIL